MWKKKQQKSTNFIQSSELIQDWNYHLHIFNTNLNVNVDITLQTFYFIISNLAFFGRLWIPHLAFSQSPLSPNAAHAHNPPDPPEKPSVARPEDVALVKPTQRHLNFGNAEFYLDWKGKLEAPLTFSSTSSPHRYQRPKRRTLTEVTPYFCAWLYRDVWRSLKSYRSCCFLRRPAVSPSVCSFESHIFFLEVYFFEGTRRSRCVEILCSFVQLGASEAPHCVQTWRQQAVAELVSLTWNCEHQLNQLYGDLLSPHENSHTS